MTTQAKVRRREILLLRVVVIGSVVLALTIFATGHYGLKSTAEHLRAGCERGAKNTVAALNTARADQIAKLAISHDPSQAPATRKALREASAIESQEAGGYTERLPISAAPLVRNKADRKAVIANDLRCDVLFPEPDMLNFH